MTTSSSVRSDHVIACAAYIIGWPIFVWVFNHFFDMLGFIGHFVEHFVEVRVGDIWIETARLPYAMSADLKSAIAACRLTSPACTVMGLAFHLVPLAIIAYGAIPRLFDGPPHAAAVRGGTWRVAHFVACLALIEGASRYLVNPLARMVLDLPGAELDYGGRWQYLTGYMLAGHASLIVAACLAARHSIRIRGWHAPSEFFDTVLAGTAKVRAHPGAPPLHVAARAAEPDAVITLLEHAANPHLRDRDGATALHIAATAGNVGAIEALIDAGANPNGIDGDGRTAVDRAELHDHPEASSALRARGGEPSKMNKPPTCRPLE